MCVQDESKFTDNHGFGSPQLLISMYVYFCVRIYAILLSLLETGMDSANSNGTYIYLSAYIFNHTYLYINLNKYIEAFKC